MEGGVEVEIGCEHAEFCSRRCGYDGMEKTEAEPQVVLLKGSSRFAVFWTIACPCLSSWTNTCYIIGFSLQLTELVQVGIFGFASFELSRIPPHNKVSHASNLIYFPRLKHCQ